MFQRIKAAQARLRGHAHVTPILTSRTLNRLVGAEVYVKCENYQRSGAFKFRGAFNVISQLSAPQQARGVLAFGSGNHPQAVALVGQILGIHTTVVVPTTAPWNKRAAATEYGATVVEYNPEVTTREAVAQALADEHGYALIPPFNHREVIAGQGTVALELFAELKQLDMLLVPCGGGGLLSGVAVASKGLDPTCRIVGIEPELADDATRSFQTKLLQTVTNPATIADGARTSSLGTLTFPLVLQHVDAMHTVPEGAIMDAVQFLFHRMKLVVEPTGALGVAALFSRAVSPAQRIGVIVSGGNVEAATMTTILGANTTSGGQSSAQQRTV